MTMAHSMRLEVVAEGVENAAQLEFLRAHRCDQIQGFLIGEARPADEITALVVAGRDGPTSTWADTAAHADAPGGDATRLH